MEDMAADLGCSKSYLSQVETGKTIPSMELLRKYIEVYQLDKPKAYKLFITAYENYNQITIKMNDLRILDREHFSRLLVIVKLFDPVIYQNNLVHALKNTIRACSHYGKGYKCRPAK